MLRIVLYTASFLIFISCDNDINVAADYQTVPIVNAFIDTEADTNFVKVEKAYLDNEKNAFDLARIADSLYFENIQVEVENDNGTTITLERIDGNLIGQPREDGVFSESPNYLYYFLTQDIFLQNGANLKLRVTQNEEELCNTNTKLIEGIRNRSTFDENSPITFERSRETRIGLGLPSGTGLFGLEFVFYYDEQNDAGEYERKSLTWRVTEGARVANNETRVTYLIEDGADFFNHLLNNLPQNTGRNRLTRYLDLHIVAAGTELRSAEELKDINSGITSSNDIPVYSNVNNGRGVFTSRTFHSINNIKLSKRTIDTLTKAEFINSLNFIN